VPVTTPTAGSRPRPFATLVGAVLAAALVLAACGTSDPDRTERPGSTSTTTRADVVATGRSTTTAAVAPTSLAAARQRCRGIDLVAIGDEAGASADLHAVAQRFAAEAPTELAKPALVCARPVEHWRDVVIQRLFTRGHPDGVLITDAEPGHAVLRFTTAEWETYKFRGKDDDATGHNFTGPPRGRTTFAGVGVILTTRGGVVMTRADSYGAVLVNAVWTWWHDEGGYRKVGLPTSAPAADPGIDGVYQDFTTAWGRLPGVFSASGAEAVTTTDRFVFTAVPDPRADAPPDAEGNIISTTGTAWFLDRAGVRHWIDSTDAFVCAQRVEQAEEIKVRGWVSASYRLGAPYVCPDQVTAAQP